MSTRLKGGDKFTCPNCGQEQDDHVEDYVVPNKTGEVSVGVDECFECGVAFEVAHVGIGAYEVRGI